MTSFSGNSNSLTLTATNVNIPGNVTLGNTVITGSFTGPGGAAVLQVNGSGAGISVSPSTGNVVITNTGVTSLTGTANEINVSSSAGSVTLSTPQAIAPISNVQFNSVSSPNLQTSLFGYPSQVGTYWQSQYHSNWNVVQSLITNNPTEWQVYTNAANGIAQSVNGTNQLVLQSGTPFSSSWVGFPYFYFNGIRYKVASFTDSSHITVQTPLGGAVSFSSSSNGTYYFAATTTTSIVNVNGTSVTYVSGQPFISIFDNNQVYINGTGYNATYNSQTSLTLATNLGTLTNATLTQYANINNELSTLRLQGLNGSNEENVALTFRPDGAWLQTLYAGSGSYRPMFFSVGENPAGTISPLVSLYPAATVGNPGQLSLGGTSANQAVQINQNNNNVNYLLLQGSATGTAPSIAARGTDATVGLTIDAQGANTTSFTSHNYANIEFQVFGNGGTSWLALGSSSSATPTISANGTASNINIALTPKGTGQVQINGTCSVNSLLYSSRSSTTSTTTITNSDIYVGINYNGATTVNLPSGASSGQGKFFIIKDESGKAALNNINIVANGGDLIDGQSSAILAINYGSITLLWNTNHWSII